MGLMVWLWPGTSVSVSEKTQDHFPTHRITMLELCRMQHIPDLKCEQCLHSAQKAAMAEQQDSC